MKKFAIVYSVALNILLVGTPPSIGSQISSPIVTARQFYRWNIDNKISGLPTAPKLLPIRSLLTPDLFNLLQQAKRTESCMVKLTPKNHKPPQFEGNLFVDSNEGITELITSTSTRQNDVTTIDSKLRYHGILGSGSWHHKLDLKQVKKSWRIDDAKLGSGKLKNILQKYVTRYRSSCG